MVHTLGLHDATTHNNNIVYLLELNTLVWHSSSDSWTLSYHVFTIATVLFTRICVSTKQASYMFVLFIV